MAKIKQISASEVSNPELKTAILAVKEKEDENTQEAMFQEILKGHFLSPAIVNINMKAGKFKAPSANQVKMLLLNTNQGKSFFPVFTDMEEAGKMQNTQGQNIRYLVRTIKDFGSAVSNPLSKVDGVVINPMSDNIVLPKQLVELLAKGETPKSIASKPTIPTGEVTFSEPQVYPTALANAVYEACQGMEKVSRVWLKLMSGGMAHAYALIIETDPKDKAVTAKIGELAQPYGKNMAVVALDYDEKLGETALKDAVPLYDKELSF